MHVFMECSHPGMVAVRKRVWGCLATFLSDVASGSMVTALEEAQVAARADPRKEKKRLERQEERLRLQGLKDMEAYGRLSKEGYRLRVDGARKRADARVAKAQERKASAVTLVGHIHELMWRHKDGHTLMVGMPSRDLMKDLAALPGCEQKMESYVSAEVRRFQWACRCGKWLWPTTGLLPLAGAEEGLASAGWMTARMERTARWNWLPRR